MSDLIGHKFKPISQQLMKSLEVSEIYFASPEQLNDPFDCQIDLRVARDLALKSQGLISTPADDARWKYLSGRLEDLLKTCGVFSLCGGQVIGPNAHLLWPHYGGSHEGVCLTYSIPDCFVIEQQIGGGSVEYTTDKLFKSITELKLDAIPTSEEMTPTIISLLTTKASAWSYEEEYRMVAYKPGPQRIPKEWLIQVSFGLRVGETKRQCLMDSMRKWGYSNCIFTEVLRVDENLFGFSLNELHRNTSPR
jgi:hypothetical protein